MNDTLKQAIEQALADSLPPGLKAAIDDILKKGATRNEVLSFIRQKAGGRGLTVLAVEHYLGADEEGRLPEALKSCQGYLTCRKAADSDDVLWTVVERNSTIASGLHLKTALTIAQEKFGRVSLCVWDYDQACFTSEMLADPNY